MLPTSTDVTLSVKSRLPNNVGAVAAFVTQGSKEAASPLLSDDDRLAVGRLLTAGVVRGKTKELAFDLGDAGKGGHRRVYVIGLGQADKVTAETIRQAAAHLAKALRKHRIGFVFQKFNLLPNLTARDNIWLTCEPDEALIFDDHYETKWERALAKIGVSAAQLSLQSGRA